MSGRRDDTSYQEYIGAIHKRVTSREVTIQDLKVRFTSGETLAHRYAKKGKPEDVKYLCEQEPPLLDSKSNSGETLLHSAAENSDPKVFYTIMKIAPKLLVEKDEYGNTPFALLAKNVSHNINHRKIMERLLKETVSEYRTNRNTLSAETSSKLQEKVKIIKDFATNLDGAGIKEIDGIPVKDIKKHIGSFLRAEVKDNSFRISDAWNGFQKHCLGVKKTAREAAHERMKKVLVGNINKGEDKAARLSPFNPNYGKKKEGRNRG